MPRATAAAAPKATATAVAAPKATATATAVPKATAVAAPKATATAVAAPKATATAARRRRWRRPKATAAAAPKAGAAAATNIAAALEAQDVKSLLLNAKLPLDTLFNHYAGGHGPSSDGRTLLLEIDEATKLLKEFKLLKGVTAEGVIAQTDAAAAFNHASKKGPREGGVAHLPRAGTTPRNSPRNPPRAILRAIP